MNNYKVAILMSTYNGEKYLKEQLDSIFAQKDIDLTLYIRDDGSSDKTVPIINEYSVNNNVEVILGNNIGAPASFAALVDYVCNLSEEYDYYAFADQDDIWLTNKIIKAISFMDNNLEPCLYCSNQTLYINGKTYGLRFNTHIPHGLRSHIIRNEISGCTMVFNKKLMDILNKIKFPEVDVLNYRIHDTWVYLVACIYGMVVYDNDSAILYRIHDNNCIGIKKHTFWDRIKRRYFNKISARNLRSKTAKELMKRCEFKSREDKEIVQSFANYQNSLFDKKKLWNLSDAICKRSGESKFALFLKIFFNIF